MNIPTTMSLTCQIMYHLIAFYDEIVGDENDILNIYNGKMYSIYTIDI